ncbi:tRNA pseudouridine(38-40) synthase TruA [Raineya orbicola]|nr:tRNA pseudouridine(38-40) synthase TruA [Raineya orbicola]
MSNFISLIFRYINEKFILLMRYFIEISYKGTAYAGWQIQKNALSVQEVIEKALSVSLREPISIVGSGRTDTGVHALQQFAHFDYASPLSSQILKNWNALLPKDITICGLYQVSQKAHSRFDAISRTYQYRIVQNKNSFLQDLALYFPYKLNVEIIQEASRLLLNYEDFESFSKIKANTPHFKCKIYEAFWQVQKDLVSGKDVLVFQISANRFLWGMVRAIVGTLLEVGQGKMSLSDFEQIIQARNRSKASAAAPACGLYLASVKYPFILSST